MVKKGIVFMFCVCMLASAFAACGGNETPAQPSETNQSPAATVPTETVAPTEPTEPDDGSVKFYYDDRISYEELGGTAASDIKILEQEVTSCIVGTKDLDAAVLYTDQANGQFIAVGVGTCLLEVDGQEVLVRVRPAPISMFMITGHSLGAGQCGDAAQSVAIEPGQAYSTHKTSSFEAANDQMGIGFAAPEKPAGIDSFQAGNNGTIGEGSALAWKWNQLTGEKAWVLNAAVGGSVISEWHKGQVYYEPAVTMFKAAQHVMTNEVKAGHYVLKYTAILYHSGANFGYKNVEYTDEVMEYWYDSMVNGFREDLMADIDGDEVLTSFDAFGFVPHSPDGFNDDKPINYYMAASDAYPNCFIASRNHADWNSDDRVKESFPAIDYQTQSVPVTMPTTVKELKADDGVHLTQVAYNACGLKLAENLYDYFYTDHVLEKINITGDNGLKVDDTLKISKVGKTEKLVVRCTPCYFGDFTITVSDNLELISPFAVKAVSGTEGTITFSKDGEVFHTIKVEIGK